MMRRICFRVRVLTRREEFRLIVFGFLTLIVSSRVFAVPQEVLKNEPSPQSSSEMRHEAGNPTPLSVLIEEAKKNDPAIHSAESAARAATFASLQASTLPDPQFTLQQFSVGSPRPFAGYTNSDFAYIGLGASQQFPYPGKRKLRGAVADGDADATKAHVEVVLKAQLERTKILREISMHHQLVGEDQAVLKRILRRPQDSPDIIPQPLSETFLRYTASELLEKARGQNPNIHEDAEMIQRNQMAVE